MKRFSAIVAIQLFICFLAAQELKVIKKEQLFELYKPESGLLVINSWATWCKPCIHELPFFIMADSMFKNSRIRWIFVSYDFVEDSNRVKKAIRNYHIPGEKYLLNETDLNSVIDSVDSGWSGTLPATWFISGLYRKPVFESFMHFDDIKKEIALLIAGSNEE